MSMRGRWLDMAPIPNWLMKAPAWMLEQWRAMPAIEDERAVIQFNRALLAAIKENRGFSWIVEVANAA